MDESIRYMYNKIKGYRYSTMMRSHPEEICIHPWNFRTPPCMIAGNIYYIGNRNVSAHLVSTREGHILIDSGFPQTVYLTLDSMRILGIDPCDIKYIIHTHAHYDHAGGTRALVELSRAKTFLGAGDAFIINKRPELFWANEYGMPFYEQFEIDELLEDGDVVSLGEISIDCVHTPGHTPGAMSYFLEVEEDGCIYKAGLHGGPGINTLSDEYITRYHLDGSWREIYFQSLMKLKNRKVDIFLAAHPSQNDTLSKIRRLNEDAATNKECGSSVNPFIDSEAWSAFLNKLESGFLRKFGTCLTLNR